MFRYVGAVVSLLVLIGAVYLGYQWGGRGLAQARADLAAVRDAAKLVKDEDDATRKRIEQRLAQVDADHKAKMDELQRGFDQQRTELQASLDKARDSSAALHGKSNSANTDLARIRKEMETASAARMETLRKREERVVALEGQFSQRAAAVDCLALPVPGDVVKTLTQVSR